MRPRIEKGAYRNKVEQRQSKVASVATFLGILQFRGRGTGGGGALGASAPPLFVPGEKVPFFGSEVPYFHRIEVPFLQNLSALFGQCPLTFEVLRRPLLQFLRMKVANGGFHHPRAGGKCPVDETS